MESPPAAVYDTVTAFLGEPEHWAEVDSVSLLSPGKLLWRARDDEWVTEVVGQSDQESIDWRDSRLPGVEISLAFGAVANATWLVLSLKGDDQGVVDPTRWAGGCASSRADLITSSSWWSSPIA